jgi:hypothetical protein
MEAWAKDVGDNLSQCLLNQANAFKARDAANQVAYQAQVGHT